VRLQLLELALSNYRNYEEQTLQFGEFNLFVGANAQGKTNLLEAILFLATTRSHRTSTDDELIRQGEQTGYLSGYVEDSIARRRIEIGNMRGKRKQVKLDGKAPAKLSSLIGLLKVVFFAPESTVIVKGAPEDRRRFLDALVSQVHADYLHSLQRYRRALQQRNESLKQVRERRSSREALQAWEEPLITAGIDVTRRRRAVCEELRPVLEQQQQYLTEGNEQAGLRYAPNVLINEDDGESRDEFGQRLMASIESDIARGTTSVGPHRDDIELVVDGRDARRFASQGQQRTLTLALKMAELDWIHRASGELPIVLLDDVTSELDELRTRLLFEALHAAPPQIFLTTTRVDRKLFGEIPGHAWEIRAGVAHPIAADAL